MALRGRIQLHALTLGDVKCPICLSIFVEPVTMPCSHTLCMPCFVQNVAQTALACPMCRKRISVWVRHSTKTNKLVDKRLWDKIQEKFSPQIEARLRDEDDYLLDEDTSIPKPKVCEPGAIRQEYEALLAEEERERSLKIKEEELASSRLIQQLQDEEKMKLRERREHQLLLCANDEAVAKEMKDAEGTHLEEEQMMRQQLCERDEYIARQIEQEEKKKSQPVIVSPIPSKKGGKKSVVTPTRGPMDIFLGQKTPNSIDKKLCNSFSRMYTDKHYSNLDKSNLSDISVDMTSMPTTSSFSPDQRANITTPVRHRKFKQITPATESFGSRLGRQLREITSSQSSESESEDVGIGSPSRYKMSGKENIGSPSRSGKVIVKVRRKSCTRERSPDIDTYCGLKTDSSEDFSCARLEDSDETDVEEFSGFQKEKVTGTKDKGDSHSKSKSSVALDDNRRHHPAKCKASTSEITGSSNTQALEEVFENGLQQTDAVSDLIKEQELLEAKIKQEEQDRLLAEALQRELNRSQVDRTRGSEDEYSLRDRKAPLSSPSASRQKSAGHSKLSPKASKKRQSTLMESMKKRQRT